MKKLKALILAFAVAGTIVCFGAAGSYKVLARMPRRME